MEDHRRSQRELYRRCECTAELRYQANLFSLRVDECRVVLRHRAAAAACVCLSVHGCGVIIMAHLVVRKGRIEAVDDLTSTSSLHRRLYTHFALKMNWNIPLPDEETPKIFWECGYTHSQTSLYLICRTSNDGPGVSK